MPDRVIVPAMMRIRGIAVVRKWWRIMPGIRGESVVARGVRRRTIRITVISSRGWVMLGPERRWL
jgi:hypothetical protein